MPIFLCRRIIFIDRVYTAFIEIDHVSHVRIYRFAHWKLTMPLYGYGTKWVGWTPRELSYLPVYYPPLSEYQWGGRGSVILSYGNPKILSNVLKRWLSSHEFASNLQFFYLSLLSKTVCGSVIIILYSHLNVYTYIYRDVIFRVLWYLDMIGVVTPSNAVRIFICCSQLCAMTLDVRSRI